MYTGKRDPVTGRTTTGHEWNGIEELDTPIPRVILLFLAATVLFSVVYWILMPAWPLGITYTKGLLGIDQREVVARQIEEAAARRAVWNERIAGAEELSQLLADNELIGHVHETGRALFADNCGVCHGVEGGGGPGYPALAAKAWLWGGEPDTLAETIRVGINSSHDETRIAQMMAFGHLGMLERNDIRNVAAYVRSLSGQTLTQAEQDRLAAGERVFADNCASCHGEDGGGTMELGAPDLTDDVWIYGGDAQSVYTTINAGREGHMPHWEGRLSAVEIRLLALYVATLGDDAP